MDGFDKLLKKTKKNIEALVNYYPNARLEIHETETMFGSIAEHLYLVDRLGNGKIILQKHLITIG